MHRLTLERLAMLRRNTDNCRVVCRYGRRRNLTSRYSILLKDCFNGSASVCIQWLGHPVGLDLARPSTCTSAVQKTC